MFSGSDIARDTIQAYLETHYHVHGDAPTTLKVGSFCQTLSALHAAADVDCSAFITACNPFSKQLDDADNARRQAGLAHTLRQRGLVILDGIGQHPTDEWPGEPSFLVLGLSLTDARSLGIAHSQNAIVWADADAVPKLILLR